MKQPILHSTTAQPFSRRQALKTLGLSAAALLTVRSNGFSTSDLSTSQMRAAAAYSAAHSGLAMLVMKNGRVIFEDYPNGHSSREEHKIYSGTKGFWILTAMKAVEEGIIDLDEKVSVTLPEWRTDENKSRVTLRQLLSFSSGLDSANQLHGDGFENRDAIAMHTPLVARPGSAFIYGPAPLQV